MNDNFIQSHARTARRDHQPDEESLDDLYETPNVATRRLEEALSRLDRAVARRHDSPHATPAAPTQRSANRATVELDDSIRDNSSMWLETGDETRLRIDPPIGQTGSGHPLPVAIHPAPTAATIRASQPAASPNPTAASPTPPAARQSLSPALATLFGTPIDAMLSVATAAETPTVAQTMPPVRPAKPVVAPEPPPSKPASSPIPFVAAWQVESFPLPETVEDLFLSSGISDALATRLCQSQHDGLRTIGVTSVARGEGRSTVAMGLAVSVAASGLKVALVDADVDGSTLAAALRLELDNGWIDAIRTGMPIAEVAVVSQSDQLTLLPLLGDAIDNSFSTGELRSLLAQLQQSFDLIIVDGGASAISTATLCDTALIVRDVKTTASTEIETYALALRRAGSKGIGIIENFCDQP